MFLLLLIDSLIQENQLEILDKTSNSLGYLNNKGRHKND